MRQMFRENRIGKQALTLLACSLLSVVLVALTGRTIAAVMSSGSYQIQSDSINFGGGLGSSSSYTLESTMGEVGTGLSTSTSYGLSAGYQAMGGSYLALTPATDVTMSPTIGGVSGGTSNGSTAFTVTTDSPAGYQVTVASSEDPAMNSGAYSIPDYAPAGATADFAFSTASNSFGFSPEGADIALRYKDNGSVCGSGSSDASDACWDGLSTAGSTVVSRTTSNHPLGTATTLKFRVHIAEQQQAGTYVATTTITAIAQ